MGGKQARKRGLQYERDVAAFARDCGLSVRKVERVGYHNDPGDLVGPSIEEFFLDCKKRTKMELGYWLDDADAEAEATGRMFGAVIHHRRGKPRSQDYVSMSAETFWRLVAYINELKEGEDNDLGAC